MWVPRSVSMASKARLDALMNLWAIAPREHALSRVERWYPNTKTGSMVDAYPVCSQLAH